MRLFSHTYLLTSSPHFFFRDEYLAYKSALFFCINPASVLFLAPLTLTLLSAATFAAMASVESGMGLFTGKSFSKALILASTNPQYYKRLFVELPVQHMKTTSAENGKNMFCACSADVLPMFFPCSVLVVFMY